MTAFRHLPPEIVSLVGFAGAALIVASVMMSSITRLRTVGLVGSATFVAYGILLGAWPVVLTNTATASLHVLHLRRLSIAQHHGQPPDDGGQISPS